VSAVAAAAAELAAALATVEGARPYADPGAVIDPPGLVLGPPALLFEGPCPEPTSARWLVYVVVPADERALETLWALVPVVAEAIDALPGAAVIRADPGTFLSGGVDLPCYEIQIDVSL
jgi:hypothetical protein